MISEKVKRNGHLDRKVFLSPDRSLEERKLRREAVAYLKKKLDAEPNSRHFIKDGKVVSVKSD